MSSISSLRDLDMRGGGSPSPFQPSGRRSPASPTIPGIGGSSNENGAFQETVDVIRKGHMDAARSALRPGSLRDELEEEIERDCESLREFLYAAQVSNSE